jgi:hypothetical protein
MRPGTDYVSNRRPRLTRRQFRGTVIRTIGYIATALVCSAFVHHIDHAWSFAIRVGLVTGIVTGIGITVNPYIEYYADNLPERRLGVFGIGLILLGFAMQSFQYWLARCSMCGSHKHCFLAVFRNPTESMPQAGITPPVPR